MVAADRPVLRIRWLGRVAYQDALALQRRLHSHSADDHLLLLEHPHVVTLGRRGRREHLLVDVEALGGSVVETDRGGEVTYHGPGQLVGYPILTVPGRRGGGMADTAAYVDGVEQLLIDVLADLGLEAGRLERHTGVWVDPDGLRPRKIAAIGVRLSRARSMHGFALNVDPDLEWFARIVPCGITGLGVTSLAAEGIDVSMQQVVDLVAQRAAGTWGRARPHRPGRCRPPVGSCRHGPVHPGRGQRLRGCRSGAGRQARRPEPRPRECRPACWAAWRLPGWTAKTMSRCRCGHASRNGCECRSAPGRRSTRSAPRCAASTW